MSMFSSNRSIIKGGTFTQVNNNFVVQSRPSQTPWDRLQAAVAPAAFHNAAERFDPPRCHPNTRIGVMAELRDLALRRGDVRILWLNGAAGAGKSAIAQSFCEECYPARSLLASFFFNRSDSSRNNAKSFVATLAYQIYREVPAYNQSLILSAMESDPLVFERSIDAQFTTLIMSPLRDLIEGGYFINNAPFVIVVDGLDECSTGAVQVGILTALHNISMLPQCPFVFVIASRPEHDIQMFFKSATSGLRGTLCQLTLDGSYHPDADIELFLREKFHELCATSPHRDSIPRGWPSNEVINTLVAKASGHFIYPSIAMKYISSSRRYPPHQLDVVLGLRPPKRGHPLAELDALYSHIVSSVEDVDLVLQILRTVILFQDGYGGRYNDLSPKHVEQLCDLEHGECLNALCDLQSVLQIDPTEGVIRLLHKSLSDYLQDPLRSHEYCIDTTSGMVALTLAKCIRIVSNPHLDENPPCRGYISKHRQLLASQIHICYESLMSFEAIHTYRFMGQDLYMNALWFSLKVLDPLCTLIGTEYEYVFRHHLHQYLELAHHNFHGRDAIITDRFPAVTVFALMGHWEACIPSEVFDILHSLGSFAHFHQFFPSISNPSAYGSLIHAVAQRCIHSLIYDRYSNTAAFALECLSMVLQDSKLSATLNEACHSLTTLLARLSTGRSLAYDFMGRSYAQMGHTVAEMRKMTRALELKACEAMKEYTERFAKEKSQIQFI